MSKSMFRWGAIVLAVAVVPATSAANLIGQWTFNDTAADETGNGNNVVLEGDPSFVALGPTNLGLSLNPAMGQYIDYGSSPLFNLTGAFTLESWVTLRSIPATGEPLIFGKDHTLFGTTFYSSGNSYSYVGSGSLVVSVPMPLNQEHHLVETWDGSMIRVYLNGALAGTFASSVAPNSNGAVPLLSGKPGPSDGTGFLDAILDETRIYTGALSAAEVSANFSAGPTQFVPRWAVESGNWHTASNWIGGVPNAPGAAANFTDSITAPATVSIDQTVTVGSLKFDNPNAYTLAGTSSLTLQASSGSALVNAVNGSHQVNLPMIFATNTDIQIATGATLTIGGSTTLKTGKTVNSSGSLHIEAPLTIEAVGVLKLNSGTVSLLGAPTLGSSAKIDVQQTSLAVKYIGETSPADQLRLMLTSGYNNGAWNGTGIMSSSLPAGMALGWRDIPVQHAVYIQRTIIGDANLDAHTDSIDFNLLLGAYGTQAGVWAGGDFNYDGKVSTLDFNLLAGNFGASAASFAPGTAVPEPGGMILVVISALVSSRRRRSA